MLDWNQKVLTQDGPISLKEMATTFADNKIPKDYHNRLYTARPKTSRFIIQQAKSFWVDVKKKFFLLNERGEWKPMEGLYFHGSTEVIFKTHFFASDLMKKCGKRVNEIVVKSNPLQQLLIIGPQKLRWSPVNSFEGIGQTFAVMKNPEIDRAEYMGTVKSYTSTQFVSVIAKGSMGVCVEPGIVAFSGVSIGNNT